MATWREDVVAALLTLGGVGSYDEVYAEVAARRADLTPAWKATVRRVIESASSDSANHRVGTPNLFYSVEGLGRGVWGLRAELNGHHSVAETANLARSAEQGFASDSVVRKAIEQYAVRYAIEYYSQSGWHDIEELGKPFDLKVSLEGTEVHVEVKGSTRSLDAVTLTRNEVEDARRFRTNHLFVLDQIDLMTGPLGEITTSGGRHRVWTDWVPSAGSLTPMVYSYRL